jgi:hypothetical protein
MSSLVVLCLSPYNRFVLLPHNEPVPLWASVGYVQTISNDVVQVSPGATPSLSRMSSFRTRSLLMLPQIHRSMYILTTLSCWTCRLLVDQHSAPYNMAGQILLNPTDTSSLSPDISYKFCILVYIVLGV